MTWKKTEAVADKALDEKGEGSAAAAEEHAVVKELRQQLRYPGRSEHHTRPCRHPYGHPSTGTTLASGSAFWQRQKYVRFRRFNGLGIVNNLRELEPFRQARRTQRPVLCAERCSQTPFPASPRAGQAGLSETLPQFGQLFEPFFVLQEEPEPPLQRSSNQSGTTKCV